MFIYISTFVNFAQQSKYLKQVIKVYACLTHTGINKKKNMSYVCEICGVYSSKVTIETRQLQMTSMCSV